MNNKKVNVVIFVLSLICLVISAKLFINMAIFTDEFNTSPDIVCGGDFWLSMDWLRLALLFVISIVSGIKLFEKKY
jgi:uncharacterized membrane protein